MRSCVYTYNYTGLNTTQAISRNKTVKNVTITIDDDLYEQLKLEAQTDRRSISNLVNVILDKYFMYLWDQEIEEDVKAGMFDDIREGVLQNIKKGKCKDL